VINGLIGLIAEDTGGVVSYVMAQQPVASRTAIEQRKPYHEHAFGRSSGLVKNGGAWNAALPWKKALYTELKLYYWFGDHFQMKCSSQCKVYKRLQIVTYCSRTAMSSVPLMSLIQRSSRRASRTSLVERVLARTAVHRLGGRLCMDAPLSHRSR
jgi:hypothetical protein